MKKTYLKPNIEMILLPSLLKAPTATSPEGPGSGGDGNDGDRGESKIFGGFVWDDAEE